MLRKSELFAINRPTQILYLHFHQFHYCKCAGIVHTSVRIPEIKTIMISIIDRQDLSVPYE